MGHIGNTVQTAFTSFDKQTITGTGTAVYTLSHSVANEQEIEVFVNNVRQEGGSGKAFTVSGNQITFSENIASTDTVYVNFQGKAVQTVTHPSSAPLQATTGTFSSNVDVGGSLLVDTIKEGTGTNTAMTIDSDGRILTPARPAFFAYLPSSVSISSTSETDMCQYMTLTDFNVGGYYSASGGFVAPLDGIYSFQVGFYFYPIAYAEAVVKKNGTNYQRLSTIVAGGTVNPFAGNFAFLMQLSSSDEVKVAVSAGTATLYHGDRNTFFSGFLVG
jgi:hypothetical protein